MKRVILGLLSTLLSASVLAADGALESSSRPLVQLRGYDRFAHVGPSDSLKYRGVTITGGGAVNSVQVSCDLRAGCFWESLIVQGVASADAMQELNRRLLESRVGFQKGECHLADLAAVEYEYEITWFGRGTRTNTFTVAHTFTAECPAPVLDLVLAILNAEGSLFANPTTRIWRSHS